MDKRLFSSCAPGYLIIPSLPDSTYDLSVGSPKNEWPEQHVSIAVKETDGGYLIKNLGEKGWGLLNMQTMQVLIPKKNAVYKEADETEFATDAFSTILALVVNDPGIRRRTIVKTDTATVVQPPGVSTASDKPGIKKLKYDVKPEGVNIAYLDIANGITDTVQLFIPAAKHVKMEEPTALKEMPKPAKTTEDAKTIDTRFIDMVLPNPNSIQDSAAEAGLVKIAEDSAGKKIKAEKKNPACKNVATYDDFVKLRKLMAVEESYDEMIKVARKKFRINCYSTEQIKNLGSMFLHDEGKYKFFVSAYPFVTDSHNFGILENQLTDNNFITKFKAILHN